MNLFRNHKNEVFWALIAILALSLSFFLGELRAKGNVRAPIIIEKCSEIK